jgi:hypothetical protein
MYYVISFLIGVLIKLYDDIIDLKLDILWNLPSINVQLIRCVIVYLTTLLCIKDYLCSIIILFSLLASHYCKPFDDPFWFYYGIIVAFTMVLFIKKMKKLFKYFFVKLFFIGTFHVIVISGSND